MEGREEDAEGGRREQVRCDGESGLAHHPQELTSSSGSSSPPGDKRSYPMVAAGAGGGGGAQEEQRNTASPSRVYAGITTTAIGSLAAKSVNVSPTPSPAKAPSPRDGLFAVDEDEDKVGLDAAGNGTSSSSTHSPSKTTTATTTTTASSQASPAPAYSALPGAPPPPSSAPARPVLMQDDSDPDKKDIPAHTIEISPGPQQESIPHSTKPHRFRLPLSMRHSKHKRRRRRRLFREPITTITSSIMPGKKHRAISNSNTANNASITTGTSSAAGLLAVPGHPGHSRSLPDDDATGHSLTEYPSKTSASSPPHTPAIDAESGINDVRGTNGLLKRVHGSWSLIGLCMANIGPVPGAFFGVHTAKEYGGYSMLAIGWPLSGLCMCLFSAVLAELSSSYPVAGAMFTWTFRTCRLSPRLRPFARYLSWICGSFLLCGHILAQMLLEFQIATVLQGLIIIFAQNYQPSTWRTILLAWACLLVSACLAANRFGRSPWLWKGVSILMISVAIILVVSLFTCTSYRNSASFIFTSYRNETGWTSKGYVYLLGWVLTSIATGQDIAGHLAEEAKQPTKTVPIGIFWGTALSYLLGWVVMLCLMAVTPEIPHAPTSTRDYGAPAQMLTEILPRPLAFVILLLIVVLMIFQDTAQLLASSRFLWALARDSAIPFSPYLRRLSPGSQLPIRATWLLCAIAAPCLLLIAGSRQIVTSLILSGCGSSLVLAYLLPVVCYLSCPKGAIDIDGRNEWTLRGASKYAAAFGSCYVILIIILMCCPNYYPVTSTSFSYAAPVIVFVILLSSLTWIFYGNSHYAGPIKSITVYTIGREVELPKLNSVHSSNRQTPLVAGRPSSPNGQNGYSGPAVTTGIEIGKTANLYSESLRTMDLAEPTGTTDMSNSFAPQSSWRSSEMASRPGMSESRRTNPVETQMTDYTEYTTDGSYTDSEEGESGSETDSRSEDGDVESGPRQRTAQRREVLPAGNAEGRRQ